MKPEFRLLKQIIDNTYAQNNISVKAGEIIGRLYYPKGFERSGQLSIKDKGIRILYDSHKSSRSFSNFNNSVRVVLFVAPAATMIELYESGLFAPSNMNGAEEETKEIVQALKQATIAAPVAVQVTVLPNVDTIKAMLSVLTISHLKEIANAYSLKVNKRSRKSTLLNKVAIAVGKENPTEEYVSELIALYTEGVA